MGADVQEAGVLVGGDLHRSWCFQERCHKTVPTLLEHWRLYAAASPGNIHVNAGCSSPASSTYTSVHGKHFWLGIATSKLQLSVAPSALFDGVLLKHPRLMQLDVTGCAV